eukprot:TRINITY_DN4436_c3_g1_i1.p1 TRINITY_DN4436_c3_g1~~TRINITY_DN4436_c3_g1_i1.p1  ORF type:complete len:331 (+),score=50.88 TRINITY_DN4436_c3_g1_i1:331-1323(+)
MVDMKHQDVSYRQAAAGDLTSTTSSHMVICTDGDSITQEDEVLDGRTTKRRCVRLEPACPLNAHREALATATAAKTIAKVAGSSSSTRHAPKNGASGIYVNPTRSEHQPQKYTDKMHKMLSDAKGGANTVVNLAYQVFMDLVYVKSFVVEPHIAAPIHDDDTLLVYFTVMREEHFRQFVKSSSRPYSLRPSLRSPIPPPTSSSPSPSPSVASSHTSPSLGPVAQSPSGSLPSSSSPSSATPASAASSAMPAQAPSSPSPLTPEAAQLPVLVVPFNYSDTTSMEGLSQLSARLGAARGTRSVDQFTLAIVDSSSSLVYYGIRPAPFRERIR